MSSDKIWKLQRKYKKKKGGGTHKVNYSWINKSYSRKAKAYMAFIYETQKSQIPNSRFSKRRFFEKHIIDQVIITFPKLKKCIKRYYLTKGRTLTQSQFVELCFARFNSMYGKDMVRSKEHPLNAKGKILKDYLYFLELNDSIDDLEVN
jgi:hypothetical protein